MNTFKDLYNYLLSCNLKSIITWIENENSQEQGYRQEALLRLFSGLGLINKLKNYEYCSGNYNKKTITKIKNYNELFYIDNKLIDFRGNKGDSSDLTCLSKTDNKHILVTTSKCLKKITVDKLDIDKILTNFKQYSGYKMTLCVCIKNIDSFTVMKERIEKTNTAVKEILNRKDTIIIDWCDLNEAYHDFRNIFSGKLFNEISKIDKPFLTFKIHQKVAVNKIMNMKTNNIQNVLLGHIQRSGKSYTIAGCIIEDGKNKNISNYLFITTAPNETIDQQYKVFDCAQLNDYNIILLNGKNKKPKLSNKNIIICSKQFLQNKNDESKITKTDKKRTIKKYLKNDNIKPKIKYTDQELQDFITNYSISNEEILSDKPLTSIKWLKDLSFDMRFVDESHNGGTTILAQKILDFYGKNSFTIHITATYYKPINNYNIPKEQWILWSLEDINLCKNINNENNKNRLSHKHGKYITELIDNYTENSIITEYSKYPELWLLTDSIDSSTLNEILEETKDNNYGWSTDSCFLLKQVVKDDVLMNTDEFQKESETLKIWCRIFGKTNKIGIPDKNYSDDKVFMKRIEKICKNPKINSRHIYSDIFKKKPMIIMAFLPQNNIDNISKATIKLLEKYNVVPDYEILSINSKTTNNPKKAIQESQIKAVNSGKKGVLVLSGKQCSLGVSIENCDVVLLLNNNNSFDMINQMMFRCMTESKNKKCGFVVDLNIHRVISSSINYGNLIKPESHPRESLKYILYEKLINLNSDDWSPSFENISMTLDDLCKNMYEIYSSNSQLVLDQLLNRIRFKEILLTKSEEKELNFMFNNYKKSNKKEKLSDTENNIKKGVEKEKYKDENSNSNSENEKVNQKINFMEVFRHFIPLISILTINLTKTSFLDMIHYIKSNEKLYCIFTEQLNIWWNKNFNLKLFETLIKIYMKYINDDIETNQIIRTVKELFLKNKYNTKQLSSLVDKYLIPQELEKKKNAEITTPYKLRQEMLDKIPSKFWTVPKKVFEPCSGKGGFLIDIVDRFMNGLKKKIPNKKERYKTIVEKCLYFSDINPTNIFICNTLLNPDEEYKLNYNEGNTLKLNIEEKWKLKGFDAVIGNPPYNSSGNTGTGNTIWQLFTKMSLKELLRKNGYLLFVHPPGWRKPCYRKSQLNGLYKLMSGENQMIYLEIHNINDGKKTFGAGTRYDWYLIEHRTKYTTTIIIDEENKKHEIDMNKLEFIPNYNIKHIIKLFNNNFDNNLEIIMDSSYHATRKYVNNIKNNEFKYPCIHSTPKSGVRYKYSNCNDKGHFGVSKVIFGEAGINHVIIDSNGKYGMTQGAIGIKINDVVEGNNIKKALLSEKFKIVLKACMWGNFRIETRIFKYFKKDFWKKFI